MTNYQPINLTYIACKLTARLMKAAVMGHLNHSHMVSAATRGFIKGLSYLTNLLGTMGLMSRWVDKGKSVDLFYRDISKAFDLVSHRFFLFKLQTSGIAENMLRGLHKFQSPCRCGLAQVCWHAQWCTTGFRVWTFAFHHDYERLIRVLWRIIYNVCGCCQALVYECWCQESASSLCYPSQGWVKSFQRVIKTWYWSSGVWMPVFIDKIRRCSEESHSFVIGLFINYWFCIVVLSCYLSHTIQLNWITFCHQTVIVLHYYQTIYASIYRIRPAALWILCLGVGFSSQAWCE